MTLTNSTVSGNTQSGIASGGTLTLINSLVEGNTGLGVFNRSVSGGVEIATISSSSVSGNTWGVANEGSLTISDSSVSDNAEGGVVNVAATTLTNSTVSGNGRGILNFGGLAADNSTISAESGLALEVGDAGSDLGVPFCNPGFVTLSSSTIVGGISVACGEAVFTSAVVNGGCSRSDFPSAWVSNRYNIESPGNTCGLTGTGDQDSITEGALNLGELADNGGPTKTHALGLLPTRSVAIDHIPAVDCGGTTDQRGEPRPAGDGCDVGAFERQPEDP